MIDIDCGATKWYKMASWYLRITYFLYTPVLVGFVVALLLKVDDEFFPKAISKGPCIIFLAATVFVSLSAICMLCLHFGWLKSNHAVLFTASIGTSVIAFFCCLIFYISYTDSKNRDTGTSSFYSYIFAYPAADETKWVTAKLSLSSLTDDQRLLVITNYITERTTQPGLSIFIIAACWLLLEFVNLYTFYFYNKVLLDNPGQPADSIVPRYN